MAKSYAKKMTEFMRQQGQATEEFRRQVNGRLGYNGMSQTELAREIPMSPSTLSDMLSEPKMFRLWQLLRIIEILGMDLESVLPIMAIPPQ